VRPPATRRPERPLLKSYIQGPHGRFAASSPPHFPAPTPASRTRRSHRPGLRGTGHRPGLERSRAAQPKASIFTPSRLVSPTLPPRPSGSLRPINTTAHRPPPPLGEHPAPPRATHICANAASSRYTTHPPPRPRPAGSRHLSTPPHIPLSASASLRPRLCPSGELSAPTRSTAFSLHGALVRHRITRDRPPQVPHGQTTPQLVAAKDGLSPPPDRGDDLDGNFELGHESK